MMIMKSNFKLTSPRPDIEIHLPDGRVLSGPRGAPVGEYLAAVEHDSQLVAAVVNGDLRELTYPIDMDSRVKPITMTIAGWHAHLPPFAHLPARDGIRRHVPGRHALHRSLRRFGRVLLPGEGARPVIGIRARVVESADAEDGQVTISPSNAGRCRWRKPVGYFLSRGEEDKVQLLKYRRKDYLTLYSLKERMDYHHGYMVPSTGYLRWFDLVPTQGGFTLRYPRRQKPDELQPMPEYPKLLAAFLQYGGWLETLGIENVGSLNDAIENWPR